MKRIILLLALLIFATCAFDCGGDSKPSNTNANASSSQLGLTIPPHIGYLRPCDGGVFYLPQAHPFDESTPEAKALRDKVIQTVCDAVANERKIALQYHPTWTLPPVSEMSVFAIDPMFYTEAEHLPGLIVTPKAADGTPTGLPVKTAGTVLNVKMNYRPVVGGPVNPFVVIARQDNWDRLDYLSNVVWYESEHLDEAWQSYQEYMNFSGANDIHPHRAPKTERLLKKFNVPFTSIASEEQGITLKR